MAKHMGVFIVEDDGQGGSLVTWRIYFDGTFIGVAPILSFILGNQVVDKGIDNLIKIYGGTNLEPKA